VFTNIERSVDCIVDVGFLKFISNVKGALEFLYCFCSDTSGTIVTPIVLALYRRYRLHQGSAVFSVFCYIAKPDGQKQEEKKPKKAAKSLKVLDPKAGQNLCK